MLRRPTTQTPAWMFIPCNYCFGFVHKKSIRKHARSCPLNTHKTMRDHVKCGNTLIRRLIPRDLAEVDVLISGMRSTEANPGAVAFNVFFCCICKAY